MMLRRTLLVLVAAVALFAPEARARTPVEDAYFDSKGVKDRGRGMRPLILRLAPPNEPRPSDDVIEQQSRAIIGRNDPLALAAVQRGNKEQTVTLAEVRGLRMPLLAVIGSADPIKAGVDAFKAIKPDLKVVVIEGATHSGVRGAPGRPEFASAVHDFLAAHR